MTTTITLGGSYTVVQPEPDPACTTRQCELCRADLINPWTTYVGKRVTVVETGLTYANVHPAVKIAVGPVEWHPAVMVTLSHEQLTALGIQPTLSAGYLMLGHVWAVDSADTQILPAGNVEDFPLETARQVEMPRQRAELIPACCLRDTTEDRRRVDRLRRLARKQGLRIRKSRVSAEQDRYVVQDARTQMFMGAPGRCLGMSLDEVEAILLERQEERA